jgi:nucleotidyltransferase/DNA polymerase involved in DNA repair
LPNVNIDDIKGIGDKTLKDLRSNNINSVKQLANISIEDLIKIKGIGKASAKKFINGAKSLLKEKETQPTYIQEVKTVEDSEVISQIKRDIKLINSKLENFNIRLERIENKIDRSYKKTSTTKTYKPKIHDRKVFSQVLRERVEYLSKNRFGSKTIPIKEVYDDLIKNYDINKSEFTELLLDLYNKEKIQLEPGTINDDFSIIDNFGNTYKIIRLLD